jgi:hypothetical protein
MVTTTITWSLIHTLCILLQHALGLICLLCLHQSLPGDGSQPYPMIPCSLSCRLATVSLVPTLLTAVSNGGWSSLCSLGKDRTENTASKSSSIVACVSVVVITLQRSLFTGLLLSEGCCIAGYLDDHCLSTCLNAKIFTFYSPLWLFHVFKNCNSYWKSLILNHSETELFEWYFREFLVSAK